MQLRELDKATLQSIKQAWMAAIARASSHREVFEADYNQLFARIETGGEVGSLKDCLNKELFAAVIDGATGAWALVELVHSQRGQSHWVKMLDIYMSPELEMAPESPDNLQRRLDIFTAGLNGIFELTKEIKGVDAVKVYGRTDTLLIFLRGMHGALSGVNSMGTIQGIQVAIEGRWLVFKAV